MSADAAPIDLSPEASAFVDHWHTLRQGDGVPSSQHFLDNAHPALQPYLSFNDIEASGANTIALFGTALADFWHTDLTGKEVRSFLDEDQADRLTTDMRLCAQKPCGIWEVSTFRTSKGRVIGWEMLTLPLDMGQSDRIRIVRYHHAVDPILRDEVIHDVLYFQQKEWLDIGAGIPATAPLMKAP